MKLTDAKVTTAILHVIDLIEEQGTDMRKLRRILEGKKRKAKAPRKPRKRPQQRKMADMLADLKDEVEK